MNPSEWLAKLNNSPAGKAVVGVVVLAAVGLVVYSGIQMASAGGSRVVGPSEVVQDGQKAIQAIQANPNISDATKKEEIAHIQGEIDQASGKSKGYAQAGPSK